MDSSYLLRVRAAAIEPELDVPNPLVPGVGYSAVYLEKAVGGPYGRCEAVGAGVYEEGILEDGVFQSGPPRPGYRGGLYNPTEAHDTAPNLAVGENPDARRPQVRNIYDGQLITDLPSRGNGPRWQARCTADTSGTAVGTLADLPGGARAVGSTTIGHLDRASGQYVGTARAFAAGLVTGGGVIDLITSVMTVKAAPGTAPTVSYRISLDGDTLAAGREVPARELAAQFNESVKDNAAAVAVLGPLGLTLLGPTVSESANGNRQIVNAPCLELTAGLDARRGIGHNNRLRLVNVDFDGRWYT